MTGVTTIAFALCSVELKNVYPCTPTFYYIKVGYKGSTLHVHVCMMHCLNRNQAVGTFIFILIPLQGNIHRRTDKVSI